ncbi:MULTISPECIES: hypothetical protein [Streptomyces]|uniref:hypothetical protein n=1 Tax=Streptomyces TaxID=1883 RepID=UPI001988A015|nr:hypothetical protein GCM10010243_06560 [Streptomyces matensis]
MHGRAHAELDPRGSDITVRGGMFAYQIVVRSERVYILQITYLGFCPGSPQHRHPGPVTGDRAGAAV